MAVKYTLCVMMLLNDNHLSNVQTLQSVYRQDCPNMLLIACNDCTNNFQSERFLYNLQTGRPPNIKKVYFYETQYPQGEFSIQKSLWNKVEADYIITLHSGERLIDNHMLRNCVEILNCDHKVAAVACSEELWSNDMKKRLEIIAPLSHDTKDSFGDKEELQQDREIRDSMLVYRLSALKYFDVSFSPEDVQISRILVPALLEQGNVIACQNKALCKYTENSIKDTNSAIPMELENAKIQKIAFMLKGQAEKSDIEKIRPSIVSSHEMEEKSGLYWKVFQYSRLKKIKTYIYFDLLLLICIGIFDISNMKYSNILTTSFLLIGIISIIWTGLMVAINLLLKIFPQKVGMK